MTTVSYYAEKCRTIYICTRINLYNTYCCIIKILFNGSLIIIIILADSWREPDGSGKKYFNKKKKNFKNTALNVFLRFNLQVFSCKTIYKVHSELFISEELSIR